MAAAEVRCAVCGERPVHDTPMESLASADGDAEEAGYQEPELERRYWHFCEAMGGGLPCEVGEARVAQWEAYQAHLWRTRCHPCWERDPGEDRVLLFLAMGGAFADL